VGFWPRISEALLLNRILLSRPAGFVVEILQKLCTVMLPNELQDRFRQPRLPGESHSVHDMVGDDSCTLLRRKILVRIASAELVFHKVPGIGRFPDIVIVCPYSAQKRVRANLFARRLSEMGHGHAVLVCAWGLGLRRGWTMQGPDSLREGNTRGGWMSTPSTNIAYWLKRVNPVYSLRDYESLSPISSGQADEPSANAECTCLGSASPDEPR
jgi:hypothetical protein